jgi:hypothetical protein
MGWSYQANKGGQGEEIQGFQPSNRPTNLLELPENHKNSLFLA